MQKCRACRKECAADDRWCPKCGAGVAADTRSPRRASWARRLAAQIGSAIFRRVLYTAVALAGSLVLLPAMRGWYSDGTFWKESPAAPTLQVTGRASVITGDSIEVRGQHIVLWGVDVPETSQLCRRDGKPWECGRDAATALTDWLSTRIVECNERARDPDKRVIAVCRVSGVDLSGWLVDNGWAMAFRRYSGDYIAKEDRAKKARRGIWASEFQPPWDWRAEHRAEGPTLANSP
jgi:endonuclease YncB( thermonuclease family)